jgi:hypothetical protein
MTSSRFFSRSSRVSRSKIPPELPELLSKVTELLLLFLVHARIGRGWEITKREGPPDVDGPSAPFRGSIPAWRTG